MTKNHSDYLEKLLGDEPGDQTKKVNLCEVCERPRMIRKTLYSYLPKNIDLCHIHDIELFRLGEHKFYQKHQRRLYEKYGPRKRSPVD